jgi:predicted alpha/beta superfamily hydrolase
MPLKMPLILRKRTPKRDTDSDLPVGQGNLWLHRLRSRVFANTRLLRVWLPPDYDGWGATSYPVLYLNDGQNLFDPSTAFAGVDWRVGETAARLIQEKKIPSLIIVGIDNTGMNRLREFIPYKSRDPKLTDPLGARYTEFLQREVMPLIQSRYPILRGPANTGLGGSSLGGLIALYTAMASPGILGQLLIESPSLFVANRKILKESRSVSTWPNRMYVGVGTKEIGNPEKDAKTVDDVRDLALILRAAGLNDTRLRVRIEEGAAHTEGAWAARFPDALEFLYAPPK